MSVSHFNYLWYLKVFVKGTSIAVFHYSCSFIYSWYLKLFLISTSITIFQYCCYCQFSFSKLVMLSKHWTVLNYTIWFRVLQDVQEETSETWCKVHPHSFNSYFPAHIIILSYELLEQLLDWKRKWKWFSYLPHKNDLCYEIFEWRTSLKITKISDF